MLSFDRKVIINDLSIKFQNLGAHPRNLGAHSTASSASGATGWYLTKCLASGVSFGARDFKTGALVGARLAYIKTKTDLADEESADEKKTELEVGFHGFSIWLLGFSLIKR